MLDLQKLASADFKRRETTLTLPSLARLSDGPPKITVRQLDGYELARCNEAIQLNRNLAETVAKLAGDNAREKAEAVANALGVSGNVPDEIAKRIEMLVIGSVEPQFDRASAVTLCTHFPVEFFQLTTEITRLTGEGSIVGESTGSGPETTSESP